ncbi:hypothetical protein [Burkholderia gladioli]|uniref:hypothetical protein n=1 Tax=Burkholderia gladioli TaxID=28095 RepID=UPI0012D30B59|nr:hypothetical protein [Burkholderia gladioli]
MDTTVNFIVTLLLVLLLAKGLSKLGLLSLFSAPPRRRRDYEVPSAFDDPNRY